VKAYDLLELATRNLRESVLRNSLTTLGIAVGVASLVAMLSLGVGLQALANKRLAKSGLFDTVVVTSRRDFRGFNRAEQTNGPPPAESRALDETVRREIERLPNVAEANPDIRFVTELRYGDTPHLTMVACLPPSAKDQDAFDAMQGRFFSSDTAAEVILQKDFAEELLGIRHAPGSATSDTSAQTAALIGKDVLLRYAERSPLPVAQPSGAPAPARARAGATKGAARSAAAAGNPADAPPQAAFSVLPREHMLRIVGITDQEPEGMRGAARGRVFIPMQFGESLHVMLPSDLRENTRSFSTVPTYVTLSVRVKNTSQIGAVQDAIRGMGFNTFSILDATRGLRRFFAVLDLFLGIFGSLALAVASLGIINTLVMAILERRREIGIMKAIGASDRDVQKLFFVEAGAMGALGGVAGVALGWAIGRVINFGTNIYLHRQDLPSEQIWSVPWWLVAGAVGFAILVSLLSGLYPASRAAKLDPVQALRYE
jgi:putative ABC transport system permease protein